MKRILLMIGMISVILCGCNRVPEETGMLDYAKMDREFGQIREDYENAPDDSADYEDDIDEIEELIEEYGEMLIGKDAEALVETFPDSFILAIADEENCDRAVAKDIAVEKVEEDFNSLEYKYRAIESLWGDEEHQISVKRIDKFYQESTLRSIYKGFDVSIADAITVRFTVSVSGESVDGDIRLVKLEDDGWEIDMSYFEI